MTDELQNLKELLALYQSGYGKQYSDYYKTMRSLSQQIYSIEHPSVVEVSIPEIPKIDEPVSNILEKAKTSALIPIAIIIGVMIAIYLFLFQRR